MKQAALKHAEYGAAVRTPAYPQTAPSWSQRIRAAFGRWSQIYQTTPALRLAPLVLLLLVSVRRRILCCQNGPGILSR